MVPILSRIWRTMGPLRYRYLVSLLGAAVGRSVVEVAIALMLRALVDAITSGDSGVLYGTLLRFSAVIIALFCTIPIARIWFESSVLAVTARLRNLVFERLCRASLFHLRYEHNADRISRLSSDVALAESSYGSSAVSALETGLWSLGALGTLLVLSPELAGYTVLLGILVLLANVRLSRPLEPLTRKVQEQRAELLAGFSDLLDGASTVRLYGLASTLGQRLSRTNRAVQAGQLQRAHVSARLGAANEFSSLGSFLGMLGVGSFLVLHGRITPGTVIACVQLHFGASQLFFRLGQVVSDWRSSLVGAERVFELLDLPVEPAAETVPRTIAAPSAPVAVEFQHVTFGYEEGKPILCDLTFSVSAGETLAIVGPPGSGKSTVLKLLLGFYRSWSGSILVDGKDLWGGTLHEARELMAYVPQRPYLFADTVLGNIACGRALGLEEARHAAQRAYIDAVIDQLPDGYGQVLGDGGSQLSAGEQQRICIARALARQAPLLLLDEPTSALDSASEEYIQVALREAARSSTVIFIAHRLWTTASADRILAMDQGCAARFTTYEEMLSNGRPVI